MVRILLAVVMAIIAAPMALGQQTVPAKGKKTTPAKMPMSHLYQPAEVSWTNGPASLPAGAKAAILSGDPTKPGQFTMRLMIPDGYRIQPHSHTNDEQVTVISGTFNVGMGDKFDESAVRELPAGSFAFMPKGMKHFAWSKGETVLQLNGIGPWTITYVNPADDPRKTPAAPVGKK